jgi:hypothetical protein
MSDESAISTRPGDDEVTPEEAEVEALDLNGDGTVSVVELERARLGLIDARLEEIADEGGVKGALAEVAHKVLDKFDNDG